jgi:hypothetical protein
MKGNIEYFEEEGQPLTPLHFEAVGRNWAENQVPGFKELPEDQQEQLILSYEKKASDYGQRPQADRQAELQALKSKPGYEGLSDGDALERQRQEKVKELDDKSASMRQGIDQREFGDIAQLDPNASAANIDKIKEQSSICRCR